MTQENSYKYGKLIGPREILWAPDYDPVRNISGYDNRPDLMLEDGYLPVHLNPRPNQMVEPEYSYVQKDGYIDQVWVDHYVAPTLAELKAQKRLDINYWRIEERKTGWAEFDGAKFGIKEQDQNNINSMSTIAGLMLSGQIPVQNQVLRDFDDKDHLYAPGQIIQVGLAIGEAVNKYYSHSWELKKLVDEATSKAALDQITWDSIKTPGVNA